MKPLRWCFIGTGKLASIVAKQFEKSKEHILVSCYSRNKEKGNEFAIKHHCTYYPDAMDAIRREDADIVYIVTPHNVHFHFAKLALEANKPVLVEKPFCMNSIEAKELVRIAKEKNLYLSEAMWTWYSYSANKVKEIIDSKRYGNVKGASFTYHLNSVNYAPRVKDRKRGGGALLDITIYPIFYAYRLFGYPKKIEAKARFENGIDLGEEVQMHFDKDIKVNISAAIDNLKGLEKGKIYFDEGKMIIPFYHSTSTFFYKKNFLSLKIYHKGKENSYLHEFDMVKKDFLQGRKESSFVPLNQTLDVMSLLDEIREKIGLVYDDLEKA